MASSRRRISQSARVRACRKSGPRTPKNNTSPIMEEMGARTGCPTSGGSRLPTSCSFSLMICRARYTSVPQSNSIQTMEKPIEEAERTRRTPVAPFMTVSIGRVTSVSTSSGAREAASVRIVTVGAVRLGNTSTGMLRARMTPVTSVATDTANTNSLFFNDHSISAIMSFPFIFFVTHHHELFLVSSTRQ